MKKFIAIYHSTPEAHAQFANAPAEAKAEGMKMWMSWKEKAGNHIIDFGAPLLPGKSGDESNNWSSMNSTIGGYSIFQADSEEDLKKLFVGHPHLMAGNGSTIELHEFMPM